MDVQAFKRLVDEALDLPDCKCNKTDFKAWKAWRTQSQKADSRILGKVNLISNMPLNQLENLGPFDHQTGSIKARGYTSHLPNGLNYWSDQAPIALYFYPYHNCDVYRCIHCKAIFLEYTETAGHAPEKRLRWVRPELVTEQK